MSPTSKENNLAELRERLAQLNSEFFYLISERRKLSVSIQSLKVGNGRFSHYTPEREIELFKQMQNEIKELSFKELLAFSLIMEDHATTLAPGSYPSWSSGIHLTNFSHELFQMINPLLLKVSHPRFFEKLELSVEFQFLKDF